MKHAFSATLMLACAAAFAQPPSGPPPGGEHRGPPPEALTACKTAKAGTDCSFTQGERTVKGSCWAPEGKPLACRPKDMPPPAGGASAPPPGR
jgi:hypothetical protein